MGVGDRADPLDWVTYGMRSPSPPIPCGGVSVELVGVGEGNTRINARTRRRQLEDTETVPNSRRVIHQVQTDHDQVVV